MQLGQIENWVSQSFELLFSGDWRLLTIYQAIFLIVVVGGIFELIGELVVFLLELFFDYVDHKYFTPVL